MTIKVRPTREALLQRLQVVAESIPARRYLPRLVWFYSVRGSATSLPQSYLRALKDNPECGAVACLAGQGATEHRVPPRQTQRAGLSTSPMRKSAMRKIEKEMTAAIRERRNWSGGNTVVVARPARPDDLGQVEIDVLLHGHTIASLMTHKNGKVQGCVNFCGWATATTSSRINAVLTAINSKLQVGRSKGEAQVSNIETGANNMVLDREPIRVTGRL